MARDAAKRDQKKNRGQSPVFFGMLLVRPRSPKTRPMMQPLRLIGALMALLGIAAAVCGDPLLITGQVTKEGSVTVIRNALVTVSRVSSSGTIAVDSARTDALGKYSIATVSLSLKVTITAAADGYQSAQNVEDISQPANGVADTIREDFALRPSITAPSDTIKITGIVADSKTHVPVFGARIIVQGTAGVGGAALSDTSRTDSTGLFALRLSDANRYFPSLAVESDGYRSKDFSLPSNSRNIQLDTMLIEKFRAGDSLTYTVSGSVADSLGDGLRGAIVVVRINMGQTLLYSGKDTSSQLGGYYSLSTKQPYYPGNVAIEVHVDKERYFSKDTVQTLASSTANAVINVILFSTTAVMYGPVAARALVPRAAAAEALFTVNGKLIRSTAAASGSMSASGVFLRATTGRASRAALQIK